MVHTVADLHSHSLHSDGRSDPDAMAHAAYDAGLDLMAITDHHYSWDSKTQMAPAVAKSVLALGRQGIVAIVGTEYSTAQGHLLIFGYRVTKLEFGLYPQMQATIDHVVARGGHCIVPHPLKGYKCRLTPEQLLGLKNIAGVESLNGNLEIQGEQHLNRKARDLCVQAGHRRIGSSDAHHASTVGVCVTVFRGDPIENEYDFLSALDEGSFTSERDDIIFQTATRSTRLIRG